MFNPTFAEIEKAFSEGYSMNTNTNESGKYLNYQKAKTESDFGQQVDGILGGYEFVSNDGLVNATIPMGVRGINIPSTLFKTKDGVILLFY